MGSRICDHLRGNVVGYIAIFLFATGGTAIALDGSNTVFSDDIVNGEVTSPTFSTARSGPSTSAISRSARISSRTTASRVSTSSTTRSAPRTSRRPRSGVQRSPATRSAPRTLARTRLAPTRSPPARSAAARSPTRTLSGHRLTAT